jgi:mevalonate kinase
VSFLRSFEVRVPGKWVLAGEHSVLRGGRALALPHPEVGLSLQFQPQVWEGLSVVPPRLEDWVLKLLDREEERARKQGRRFTRPRGSVIVESTIPFGAGMGSSAALSVAVARWLQEESRLEDSEIFSFARALEDEFHGKSSGMDVAAVLGGTPLLFSMKTGAEPLGLTRLPRFRFHDTGLRAATRDCVQKVLALGETQPEVARALDERMAEAVSLAEEGLRAFEGHPEAGLSPLIASMALSQSCFEGWGLVPASVQDQIKKLKESGALAVRLTGAGGGGFLVELLPASFMA